VNERTCTRCGWVHFAVTRQHAEEEVASFNSFYDKADRKTQRAYGRRSSITLYERCGLCGGPYTDFRESREGDCPRGCTLSPIIYEPP